MKNIIYSIITSVFIVFSSFSQEEKDQNSKMQEFVSKTGTIIKFENYNLSSIKLIYGLAESKIRKIVAGDQVQYFLQISKSGKYNTKTASIAYEDIIEIQKALETLKNQSEIDINTSSDYLENKFVTDDGFKIGYYVNKGKVSWYMNLEKYGNDNTVFVKDCITLENALLEGKNKIEELKTL